MWVDNWTQGSGVISIEDRSQNRSHSLQLERYFLLSMHSEEASSKIGFKPKKGFTQDAHVGDYRRQDWPAALAAFRASVTDKKAVSVEWPLLKPDWFGLRRLFCDRNSETCLKTAFSIHLDRMEVVRQVDSSPHEQGQVSILWAEELPEPVWKQVVIFLKPVKHLSHVWLLVQWREIWPGGGLWEQDPVYM